MPPPDPGPAFAAELRHDGGALRDRLALPLFLAASHGFRGDDRRRLDALARLAALADCTLLATNDVRYHHPDRRRLADVLTAIRLRTTVDALGYAAEANAERHLKPSGEMVRLFAGHQEAIADTLKALEACQTAQESLGARFCTQTSRCRNVPNWRRGRR